jgi:hypothetical protein
LSQLGWVDSGMAVAPAFANESGKSEFSQGAEVSSFVNRLVVLL